MIDELFWKLLKIEKLKLFLQLLGFSYTAFEGFECLLYGFENACSDLLFREKFTPSILTVFFIILRRFMSQMPH